MQIIISIFEGSDKKKEGGSEKGGGGGGVKLHPFNLPWIRACLISADKDIIIWFRRKARLTFRTCLQASCKS